LNIISAYKGFRNPFFLDYSGNQVSKEPKVSTLGQNYPCGTVFSLPYMILMKTVGEFLFSDFWPSLLSRAVHTRHLLESQEHRVPEERPNIIYSWFWLEHWPWEQRLTCACAAACATSAGISCHCHQKKQSCLSLIIYSCSCATPPFACGWGTDQS